MQKKFVCILAATFLYAAVLGQKVISQTQELAWRVEPVMGNYNNANYPMFVDSYRKGIIPVSENQVIVTMRYPKDNFGLALMDNKGKQNGKRRSMDGFSPLAKCRTGSLYCIPGILNRLQTKAL